MCKIIEIEGIDKSGKETQAKLLKEKLIDMGYKVTLFSFPNYDSESSIFVKQYLNGEIGDIYSFNPYQASMFYAMDRLITYKKEIEPIMDDYDFIILDRYIISNLIHQGAKYIAPVYDLKEKKSGYVISDEYFNFIHNWYNFELVKLGLPIPDAIIMLDMPIELGNKISKNRKNKFTGKEKEDIHESNNEFMNLSYASEKLLLEQDFGIERIKCYTKGLFGRKKLRTIKDINNEILKYCKTKFNLK